MAWIMNALARPTRYSGMAKAMHWAVAVAVIAMIPEGLAMKRLIAEGPIRESLYNIQRPSGRWC
jgi:cytochrome b561